MAILDSTSRRVELDVKSGTHSRAVLVGCGQMSREWLEAAAKLDSLDIVGLSDIDTARARARAVEFGLSNAAISGDLSSLLTTVRPDILFDVVVPEARHTIVAAGLAAGCDVLSEKPMATSLVAARDLITRADAAGRFYAVMQNYRYFSPVRRITRLIASRAIGDITSVHADFFLAPHFGGFREEMNHVLLLDMAIHAFDAVRCMTGLSATGVYCREWDPKETWFRQGSSAVAVFDLTGGALFTYRGSWAAEGARSSWQCSWRFQGTRGSIVWNGEDEIRAEVAGVRRGLLAETIPIGMPDAVPEDGVDGHLGLIREFTTAVRARRIPETVGRDNIKSLAMVFAAIESSEQGQPVKISP